MKRALRAGLAVGLAASSFLVLPAQPPADAPNEHGGRLQFVQSLIEESSAAKRIDSSPNTEARAKRESARAMIRQAETAHRAGEHARAEQLIKDAARTMFEAVHLAEQDGSYRARKEKDYDSRLSSVEALVAAFERICDEKKCPAAERGEVKRSVEERVRESRRLRAQGDIDGARGRLDQAYVGIKVAIEHRRSGDTLVRALQFKNKEEEYRYELDRNDTHRMLIRMLAEERVQGTAAGALQKQLEQAASIRAQAEREAASGQFETAIRTLEEATRELQKALRGAGIYIPG